MKKLLLLASLSLIIFGCNMNPSKETRIQQLESDREQTLKKIDKLEIRVQTLENVNEQLESRILALENGKNTGS